MQLPHPISLGQDLSPHSFSSQANWLIPNCVLLGEAPSSQDVDFICDIVHRAHCNTFVCLRAEVISPSVDATWLGGHKIHPQDYDTLEESYGPRVTSTALHPSSQRDNDDENQTNVSFFHYGIRDFGVAPSLSSLHELIQRLVECIHAGNILYIHCKAGKGRTGLVAACLLLMCYPTMKVEESLKRVSLYCVLRASEGEEKDWYMSPETEDQRQQVVDFASWIHSKKNEL